jgi:hypothetical protein
MVIVVGFSFEPLRLEKYICILCSTWQSTALSALAITPILLCKEKQKDDNKIFRYKCSIRSVKINITFNKYNKIFVFVLLGLCFLRELK